MVICAVCAVKESKITGLYKTFGVYGRLSAYFGLYCPLGIMMFIACFFIEEIPISQGFLFLGLAAVGAFLYWNAYRKCPAFLKKKCILCMMISGLGIAAKLCLFFLSFVWELVGPTEMKDESGNTVYVYGDEVYDENGEKIGIASADKTSYIHIKQ